MKNPTPEIPYSPQIVDLPLTWEPLYIWLREIFSDRYKDAASGFMYMGALQLFEGVIVHNYKHGITRKCVLLQDDGTSIKLDIDRRKVEQDGRTFYEDYLIQIEKESFLESYKHVYKDIEKHFGADLGVFTKYNDDYVAKRDALLKELGYNQILTINPKNPEEFINQL